jgi:hypothetical protein
MMFLKTPFVLKEHGSPKVMGESFVDGGRVVIVPRRE